MADDPPDPNKELMATLQTALESAAAGAAKGGKGSDPEGALTRILADAIHAKFLEDNVNLRSKNRELAKENADLKAKLPDGAIVLVGDDAAAWTALGKVGVPVKDVPTALSEGLTAKQKVALREKKDAAATAAELVGFNPDVLWDRLERDGLALTLREHDGKQEAFVTVDGKPVALAEYAESKWALYLPALQSTDRPAPPPSATTGPPALPMRSGTKPLKTGYDVEAIAAEQRARGAAALL